MRLIGGFYFDSGRSRSHLCETEDHYLPPFGCLAYSIPVDPTFGVWRCHVLAFYVGSDLRLFLLTRHSWSATTTKGRLNSNVFYRSRIVGRSLASLNLFIMPALNKFIALSVLALAVVSRAAPYTVVADYEFDAEDDEYDLYPRQVDDSCDPDPGTTGLVIYLIVKRVYSSHIVYSRHRRYDSPGYVLRTSDLLPQPQHRRITGCG